MTERWDHRVTLNVAGGGPTLWLMEGSALGPRRTLRRVGRNNDSPPPNYPDARRRKVMKCIAAVFIVMGMFMAAAGATPHVPNTRAPITSRTVSHGQSSRKISIPATLFGGLFLPMSEGSFVKLAHLLRPPLQKNKRFGS